MQFDSTISGKVFEPEVEPVGKVLCVNQEPTMVTIRGPNTASTTYRFFTLEDDTRDPSGQPALREVALEGRYLCTQLTHCPGEEDAFLDAVADIVEKTPAPTFEPQAGPPHLPEIFGLMYSKG